MVSLSQWAFDLTGVARPPAPVVELKVEAPPEPVEIVADPVRQRALIALSTEMEEHCAEELAFVRRMMAAGERAVDRTWTDDEAEICLRGEMS